MYPTELIRPTNNSSPEDGILLGADVVGTQDTLPSIADDPVRLEQTRVWRVDPTVLVKPRITTAQVTKEMDQFGVGRCHGVVFSEVLPTVVLGRVVWVGRFEEGIDYPYCVVRYYRCTWGRGGL